MPELHGDLFSLLTSPFDVCVFVVVDERGEDFHVRRDLSSMQRKTAKKEAWRPKCAAPRLVDDSALFLETSMHVYVRTTYYQVLMMPWYGIRTLFFITSEYYNRVVFCFFATTAVRA